MNILANNAEVVVIYHKLIWDGNSWINIIGSQKPETSNGDSAGNGKSCLQQLSIPETFYQSLYQSSSKSSWVSCSLKESRRIKSALNLKMFTTCCQFDRFRWSYWLLTHVSISGEKEDVAEWQGEVFGWQLHKHTVSWDLWKTCNETLGKLEIF